MAIYSVYLPPNQSGKEAMERFRLLRDAKAPLALIFPPFWLAWHRLWLELLVYAVVAIGIAMLAAWKPLPPVFYLSAIPGLYLLLEGNELIRRKLERKGWRFAGVVDGANQEEAEIRFVVENENLLTPTMPERHHQSTEFSQAPLMSSAPAGIFPE